MKKLLFILFLLFYAMSARATATVISTASLIDCADGPSSIHNIVEPLNESSRTYANGAVRVIHLDTGGEPACCSSYLAILSPNPNDELGNRQCKLLASDKHGLGFMDIVIKRIDSSYDSSKGLLLSVPVLLYGEGDATIKNSVDIRINQTSGAIVLEH